MNNKAKDYTDAQLVDQYETVFRGMLKLCDYGKGEALLMMFEHLPTRRVMVEMLDRFQLRTNTATNTRDTK